VIPFNSIQFGSIIVYLRANLTAQKPITQLKRVLRKKQQKAYKENIKYVSLYNLATEAGTQSRRITVEEQT
jgi:hypothetical protein